MAREGHTVPPFENHVPLLLTPNCFSFSESLSKLDHMTYFGFHGNGFKCLMWLKCIFLKKRQTNDNVQVAIVLVWNEIANIKIAL